MEEKKLSEKESLELIARMINKAKDSYNDTGLSAIMWGTVITICSLETLAEIQFGYKLPVDIYWLTLVAVIPQIFLSIKQRKRRKVKSFDDAYLDYIWLGFGICVFLLSFINGNIYNSLNPVLQKYNEIANGQTGWIHFQFNEYVMSLFLLLYGLPTFITGAACKFKPMLWGGLFCWVCCIVCIYTNIKIDLALTAASAIMAWLIPGLLMQKEYRTCKKQQAGQHV